MHQRLKKLWGHLNPLLGKMWVRLVVLVTATVVNLPTHLPRWLFRTYDSHQSNLHSRFDLGISHIVSETPNRIEIGTVMLINISEETSSYDREISAAFIQRLKQSPAEAQANRKLLDTITGWGYAQKMLQWLKHQNKKYDLHYVDLRNQDFFDETAGITLCDLFNMHKGGALDIDVARSGFSSWDEFFGCCPYAREKLETAKRHTRDQHEALLKAQLEPDYQPPTIDELPSMPIMVTCNYCGKNSKPPTNTAK